MTYLQKKRMLIAFITLWLSIFIIGIYQGIEKSHASGFYYNSNNYPRGSGATSEKIIIGKNYFPPRIHQLCQDNYIGTDWDKAMKYEKRCRGLWDEWTREILHSAIQY